MVDYICFVCHKIFDEPIYLPCLCKISICKEHTTLTSNRDSNFSINCPKCNLSFNIVSIYDPKKENTLLKRQIENSFHLSPSIKQLKKDFDSCLDSMNNLTNELRQNIDEFSLVQANHFENVRRDIDIRRETLLQGLALGKEVLNETYVIENINEQSQKLIEQIEMAEKAFRQSFNREIKYSIFKYFKFLGSICYTVFLK
jgi:hypothetical protein